ncbi:TonB-dependent receptor plug domain-containing protein [Pseudoduganella violacea]|uniref:Outer membrane receptor protein involved in Fe transport n=1 Tax=Pseudoduganella violacea TaxID=1715466 RepID=A0A7W5B824_9BURK|nr:TonB-dependent receptor [Pseudoduganella violacea]MBB3118136.1 outer membrane receptor protein involved in Fe transport [Pseudoduganella violacea]
MLRHRLPVRLTLSAAILAACHAYAEEKPLSAAEEPKQEAKQEPARAAEGKKIQQVEIKGSAAAYDPRRDDTASKIIVSNEEILRYGDTSINDVLKRLPGITVGGGGRGGADIRMRGLGNGYTQILLNGEKAPAGFSIDSLTPDSIERIEILRAASAEYSTQSIAGTINIVLKKAVKTAAREFKFSQGKGEDFSSPWLNLTMSDRDGNFSYSLNGNMGRYNYHRQSPSDALDTAPDGTVTREVHGNQLDIGRSDSINLGPRLNWTLANGDTVTWQSFISANRFRNTGDADERAKIGRSSLSPRMFLRSDGRNAFLRSDLNWVHKLAEGAKLDTKLGYNGNRNESTLIQYGSNGPVQQLARRVERESREHGFSSTGKYSTPLIPGHALSMGWDGGISRRNDERHQRDADLRPLRPADSSIPVPAPINCEEGFRAEVTRLAAFAQDEWNITPQWSVYVGLRWEGVQTSVSGSGIDDVKSRTSVFSPLLQTLWKLPNSQDQLRFALTRTYKAPPTSMLSPRRFTSTDNKQTSPDYHGNPNLKPELATGLDLSFEHYWAESALLSAAASVRRINGYTRQGLVLEGERWVSMPVNDGSAIVRNLELEAKFPLKAVMKDAPQLDLRASVSRNWSRVKAVPGPHNRLDQQVPLSATLGMDYKTQDGKFSTGGSFSFRAGGPVRITETQSSYQTARRELDVYALWKFDPKQQLRLALSNILDQDYRSESSFSDQNGVMRQSSVMAGSAAVRLTLEMKF